MDAPLPPFDIRIKRLRWRCRRGTTELDRLLVRHLDRLIALADEEQLDRFEQLLLEEDRELQRWLLGYQPCDVPEFVELIDAIGAVDRP